jgi:hypothetical protein
MVQQEDVSRFIQVTYLTYYHAAWAGNLQHAIAIWVTTHTQRRNNAAFPEPIIQQEWSNLPSTVEPREVLRFEAGIGHEANGN